MSVSTDVHMQFIVFPGYPGYHARHGIFKDLNRRQIQQACIFIARAFHNNFMLTEKEEQCLLYFFPDTPRILVLTYIN